MTTKDCAVTVGEQLAEEARRRIAGLRRETTTATDAERKVRELNGCNYTVRWLSAWGHATP